MVPQTRNHQQPTVLVSQPSMELTDRMYADLVDSLRYSRDAAEKRATEAEKRATLAETQLHALYARSTIPVAPSIPGDREESHE